MIDGADIMRQALRAGSFDQVQNQSVSTHQMNQAAVQSGQALGFHMEVESNPLAELMDSMEELTFQFEEKEMKQIGDRKFGELRSPKSAYLTAVEKWQKVMPDLPGGEFAERMLRNLRQRDAMPSMQQFFKMLGEGSSDASHQFAMLEIMEEALKPGEDELQKFLADAKRTLTEMKGPEIRAGINLAELVNAKAQSLEQMQELRDMYRGEVVGFTTPQACFRSLLAQHGAERLASSLEFLFQGLGVDLQSASPSRSMAELGRILQDLQCVEVLKTVLDKCTQLAGKMSTQFGQTCLLSGEKITGRIMEFTEMPFVNSGNIASLISSCGIKMLLAQLYFCTTLTGLFRGLSPRLFSEEGERGKLIDAAQEHLDGLVALQEDEEKEEAERKKKRGAA